ncbi:drug/metabolite transporter (DMT)-like permease [Pseudoroseicyclus aestuarii]|uniref:Drug/metabolite transporter (DMT)-like permease n=2 Tax=Pseudoroseicyclus aestuarii TaxID=1795041 RepID=A0A318T0D6_9RHOB|nr:drug/metabolite transporter (DMT)-like permease [Pseudoroseicyclus aestuarii]
MAGPSACNATVMADQKSLSPLAWLQMAALASIWGAVFLATSVALRETGPFWVVAVRCCGGAAVLWLVLLARRGTLPARGDWGSLLVMGITNNLLPFSLLAWAQTQVESGLVAILNASTAIFGVLFAALFFADERLGARRGIGVALGFSGVVLAIGPEALRGLDPRALGQIAVIGATLGYAVSGIWARKRLAHLPPLTVAAGMTACGGAMALPLAFWIEGVPVLPSVQGLLALSYVAFVATGLAFLLFYRIMATAGAGNTLLVTLLVAPIALVLGALILGEALPPQDYLGFALLASGLAVIDGRILRRVQIAMAPSGKPR